LSLKRKLKGQKNIFVVVIFDKNNNN